MARRATLAGVLVLAAVLPGPARAGGEEDGHLRFRRSYGEAWLEARVRNLPVLVSRHKDG